MLNILCDIIHDVLDKHRLTDLTDRVIRQFRKRLASVAAAENEHKLHVTA